MQQRPHDKTTRTYRIYLLDGANKIAKAHNIDAVSDDEACELAKLMLDEEKSYPAAEVWDRTRTVRRLSEERIERLARVGQPRLDDWDIVRAAEHMVLVHGERAIATANRRAEAADDASVEKRWREIAVTIPKIDERR